MSDLVIVTLDGPVARITVNRPQKLNAFSSAVMEAFVAAFEGLPPEVRAVVLTGAGEKAFIGGADVRELEALNHANARAFITRVHRCCQAIRDCPAPVIARIDGYVLGAGLEIAAACDLRAASARSVFGMPEVRLGIPSVVEAALLPQLIGWGKTRELLLVGGNIDAAEAARIGLVDRLVEPAGLEAAVGAWLEGILANGQRAVALQKALIRRWEELPMSDAIAAGIDAFEAAFETDEPGRMMAVFRAGGR